MRGEKDAKAEEFAKYVARALGAARKQHIAMERAFSRAIMKNRIKELPWYKRPVEFAYLLWLEFKYWFVNLKVSLKIYRRTRRRRFKSTIEE